MLEKRYYLANVFGMPTAKECSLALVVFDGKMYDIHGRSDTTEGLAYAIHTTLGIPSIHALPDDTLTARVDGTDVKLHRAAGEDMRSFLKELRLLSRKKRS